MFHQTPNVVIHAFYTSKIILHVALVFPDFQVTSHQAFRRFQLHIVGCEVVSHPHGCLACSVRSAAVIIVKCFRQGHCLVGPLGLLVCSWLPVAVGCLVVTHQEKRLVRWPFLQKINRKIGDQISAVTAFFFLLGSRVKDRVMIITLTRQDLPLIKPSWVAA